MKIIFAADFSGCDISNRAVAPFALYQQLGTPTVSGQKIALATLGASSFDPNHPQIA
ncbi:MAG: hypothetical protein ACYDDT_00060 [Sulfuricella sp.]